MRNWCWYSGEIQVNIVNFAKREKTRSVVSVAVQCHLFLTLKVHLELEMNFVVVDHPQGTLPDIPLKYDIGNCDENQKNVTKPAKSRHTIICGSLTQNIIFQLKIVGSLIGGFNYISLKDSDGSLTQAQTWVGFVTFACFSLTQIMSVKWATKIVAVSLQNNVK